MHDQIDISVVIATYNRCGFLLTSLDSLIKQRFKTYLRYEIIVVDDGSSDKTRDVVSEVSANTDVPIVYVHQEGKGVAAARNISIQNARGQWLVFFDDDQIAEPTYIQELYATAQKHNADCVGGTRFLDLDFKQLRKLHPFFRALLGEIIYSRECKILTWKWFPNTGNSLIKRSAVDKVGYFNESLQTGGEDLDFFRRFRMQGFEVWQTPNAVSYHMTPMSRLRPESLKRSSLRSGANHAYMNYKEWGKEKTLLFLVLLIGRTMLVIFPKLCWAWLRKRKRLVLGESCRILAVLGYFRKILQLFWPRLFQQNQFFTELAFRREKDRERIESSDPLATEDRKLL